MLLVLQHGTSIDLIKGFFSLTLVFNTGAAFGIFPDKRLLFLILPVLTIILVVLIYLKAKDRKDVFIPLSFLMGGAAGNFIDRMRFGHVIDFFDIYLKKYHWPAFNFADVFICAGIFLLIFKMFPKKNQKGK